MNVTALELRCWQELDAVSTVGCKDATKHATLGRLFKGLEAATLALQDGQGAQAQHGRFTL